MRSEARRQEPHRFERRCGLSPWLALGGVLACSADEARVVELGADDGAAMSAAGTAGVPGRPSTSPESSVRPALPGAPPALGGSGPGEGGMAGPASAVTSDPMGNEEFRWDLPPGFPLPVVPEDNPMSVAKVELGRHLFYDERLSANQTMSCATCHRQELAFTDGRAVAVGSTGQLHSRGSMSLANVAYASTLTWGHPYLSPLERQAAVPMFGTDPVELGLTSEAQIEERLRGIDVYRALFAAAFPGDREPIQVANLVRALSAFERTLISGRSPYDRWAYGGEPDAISAAAQRGFELFYSERLECFHCHVGFAMTDHITYQVQRNPGLLFHNTGLYNLGGSGAFPEPNTGIHSVTQDPADMGKFKAPSLRNIAVTAPYMHDGSIATLSEVLDHYAAGGRTLSSGPYSGAGSESPLVSELVRGFTLTEQERADVIAFLESLTDETFLTNPALSNPWQ